MYSNLHEGHRSRMIKRLLNDADNLSDHELLEVLLYPVIPRKDVNPLAHKLILVFGSLKNVFYADEKQLLSVTGVGDKTAAAILTAGAIFKRAFSLNLDSGLKRWESFDATKNDVIKMFEGLLEERFVILLLDKNFMLLNKMVFEGSNDYSVSVDFKDVTAAIALAKPRYAVIAHNHTSGNVFPSLNDDVSTARLNNLCEIHGVELVEHVIVANNQAFSYHNSPEHRLEIIKNNIGSKHIEKDLKEFFSYDEGFYY